MIAALLEGEGEAKRDRPSLELFINLRGFGHHVIALNTGLKSALSHLHNEMVTWCTCIFCAPQDAATFLSREQSRKSLATA